MRTECAMDYVCVHTKTNIIVTADNKPPLNCLKTKRGNQNKIRPPLPSLGERQSKQTPEKTCIALSFRTILSILIYLRSHRFRNSDYLYINIICVHKNQFIVIIHHHHCAVVVSHDCLNASACCFHICLSCAIFCQIAIRVMICLLFFCFCFWYF